VIFTGEPGGWGVERGGKGFVRNARRGAGSNHWSKGNNRMTAAVTENLAKRRRWEPREGETNARGLGASRWGERERRRRGGEEICQQGSVEGKLDDAGANRGGGQIRRCY